MIIRIPPSPIFFRADQSSRILSASDPNCPLSPTGSRYGFCFHRTTRGLCTSYTPCPSPPPTPMSRPSRPALLRSPPSFHRLSGQPGAGWLQGGLPTLWRVPSNAVSTQVMERGKRSAVGTLFSRGTFTWVFIRSWEMAARKTQCAWQKRTKTLSVSRLQGVNAREDLDSV